MQKFISVFNIWKKLVFLFDHSGMFNSTWERTIFYWDANLFSSFGKIFSIFCICIHTSMYYVCVCGWTLFLGPTTKLMNYCYYYYSKQYEFSIKPTYNRIVMSQKRIWKKKLSPQNILMWMNVWGVGVDVGGAIPNFEQLIKFHKLII